VKFDPLSFHCNMGLFCSRGAADAVEATIDPKKKVPLPDDFEASVAEIEAKHPSQLTSFSQSPIQAVNYLSKDHCNYSTSGFDASEEEEFYIIVSLGKRGYILKAGYYWFSEDRGDSDRQEFRHFAQSISGGPEFGQDGTKPEDIVEEMSLSSLSSSQKTQLRQVLRKCTQRH
ncbi:U3 small nucleolar RNA-associated protein 4, partial [Durusdinium trenchii]